MSQQKDERATRQQVSRNGVCQMNKQKFCPGCRIKDGGIQGRPVYDKWKFCQFCGTELKTEVRD